MPAPTPSMLVADIGGTNARFARVSADGRPGPSRLFKVEDCARLDQAIETFLADDTSDRTRPLAAALAVATPVTSDRIKLTNVDKPSWEFRISELQASLGLQRLEVINDFTALAWSLPGLLPTDWQQVGGGEPVAQAALALIGPGTGLGVSGLVYGRDGYLPIAGEGGHVSLSPADDREAAMLQLAWRQHPHVSTERLVSGIGLPLLCRLVAQVDGLAPPPADLTPQWITDRALAGDPLGLATINTFCAMLGTAAANLALTLGARGGVYVGGGIPPRLKHLFALSPFRSRFESKGRFSDYLRNVPTRVLVAPDLALAGAARALMRA